MTREEWESKTAGKASPYTHDGMRNTRASLQRDASRYIINDHTSEVLEDIIAERRNRPAKVIPMPGDRARNRVETDRLRLLAKMEQEQAMSDYTPERAS